MACVFNLKLNALLEQTTKEKSGLRYGRKREGSIFGKVSQASMPLHILTSQCVAHVHVIENQKRGPHAHILLVLDSITKPSSPALIDRSVSAELPDQITHLDLDEVVSTHMIHSYDSSRCRKDTSVDNSPGPSFPRR